MKRACIILAIAITLSFGAVAQTTPPTSDVLGVHNLSGASSSPLKSGGAGSCQFCHAPHSGVGGRTPLWSQTLSTQTYSTYTSPTAQNAQAQPVLGGDSSLCLSCHDGTVAVGTSVPYGKISMTGTWNKGDNLGTNLTGSHPFSLNLVNGSMKDASNLVASLVASHTTTDPSGAVKLIQNNVECTTCHNPHVQNIDTAAPMFLVRDNHNGAVCLSCHETGARTVNGQTNPLAGWTSSVHATATQTRVAGAAKLGSYTYVAEFACQECHAPHNAAGSASLLRAPDPPIANVDNASQPCLVCHNGGSNLTPAVPNVGSEMVKATSHPVPTGTSTSNHSASEAILLQNNRHATCVDCHNAHDSLAVSTFSAPPGIRASQNAVTGITLPDGTAVTPAANQYENCLRCHGASAGKQVLAGYMPTRIVANVADRWNVISEFAQTATSSHPVTHDSNSPRPQPSLRPYMLNLDGINASSRTLSAGSGGRLLCTDCHNSDDNREFGGSGPNGPHGSANLHVLERRYEYTQVPTGALPGSPVSQLWQHPSTLAGGAAPGPFALCGKCHDLNNIMTDASFKGVPKGGSGKAPGGHFTHLDFGISCSVCHTGHGMGAQSSTISGEALVNFDATVVGPLAANPISYNRTTNTCTLQCHGYDHDGTNPAKGTVVKKSH